MKRILALACLTAACGSDYRPPTIDVTGIPAAPLDRIFDLDVVLPGLHVAGARARGIEMEVRIHLEEPGFGSLPARYELGPARVDGVEVPVTDLRPGKRTLLWTETQWFSGQIGPLVVENTPFELVLNGAPAADGLTAVGAAYETQTGTAGSFEAWRRRRFLVAGTDFLSSVGTLSEVALVRGDEIRVRPNLATVASDAVLRVTGGALFAVNRLSFDNLQRLDPTLDYGTTWQHTTGAGSNPQDVVLASSGFAYVSRYEPPYDDVAVVSPDDGAIVGSIALETLAENPTSTPRAAAMAEIDGVLFVALQDIDAGFSIYEEGKLALIDPAADTILDVLPLSGVNPWSLAVVEDEDGEAGLFVSLAGRFLPQELSGGIVRVDPFARTVTAVVLDDDDAGGNLAALVMRDPALGYVVATDASFTNRVLAFDAEAGAVLRTVFESPDYVPTLALDSGGLLAIPDRAVAAPRLCLYETAREGEDPVGCGALPLPPFSVVALD